MRPIKYSGRYTVTAAHSTHPVYATSFALQAPTGLLFLFLRFGGQPYRLSNPRFGLGGRPKRPKAHSRPQGREAMPTAAQGPRGVESREGRESKAKQSPRGRHPVKAMSDKTRVKQHQYTMQHITWNIVWIG